MAKMRVHELAKELNIKPQEIMDKLKGTAYEVKTSSSRSALRKTSTTNRKTLSSLTSSVTVTSLTAP